MLARLRSEDTMGGWKKGGGWKTSRTTPLPKRGFGPPPLVRYVFHPPQVSVLFVSCTKIQDRAEQKLFWRGPTIFGRARSLVRFPPPIRSAPPPYHGPIRDCHASSWLNCTRPGLTRGLNDKDNFCRVENFLKSRLCGCRASGEEWRETSREKLWAFLSFVS